MPENETMGGKGITLVKVEGMCPNAVEQGSRILARYGWQKCAFTA